MRRTLIWTMVVGLVASPFILVALFTDRAPLVPPQTAGPESAIATRNIVHKVRSATKDGGDTSEVVATVEELNGVIAFGSRVMRGLRGDARIEGGEVHFRGSAPVPLIPALGWVNVELSVPPFEGRGRISAVRVGGIDLPPGLMLALGVGGTNLVLGGRTGDRIMAAVPRLEISETAVTARLNMDDAGRSALMRRITGVIRGNEMPTGADIARHERLIRTAMDAGELPVTGSFLPYLDFIVESARIHAKPDRLETEFTAALFALTKICGAKGFTLVVGRLAKSEVPDTPDTWATDCLAVTFAERIDSKRHFITAAAIKAASTVSVSFTIGEFKELVDSISGAGGFDFTDIAANASGIRFAETFMSAPGGRWSALADRMGREEDVLVPFEGIPGLMPLDRFEAEFGDADSPAYKAMVEKIEQKIDGLALHGGVPRPAR